VLAQRGAGPVGEHAEVGAPVTGRLGHLDLRLDRVQHQVEQFFLGRDVPVQGHRPGPDLPRDAAHADRVGTLGVGHGDGGADDLVPGQPAVTARRLCSPRLVPLDVPGDLLLAGRLPGRPRGVRVVARVPEERPLLLVALACAVRPARLLLLTHCCSFRRPACPNQRGPTRPGDDEIKLASSYTVLLWYTVLERTTYE
jgi:hypothetical protein